MARFHIPTYLRDYGWDEAVRRGGTRTDFILWAQAAESELAVNPGLTNNFNNGGPFVEFTTDHVLNGHAVRLIWELEDHGSSNYLVVDLTVIDGAP